MHHCFALCATSPAWELVAHRCGSDSWDKREKIEPGKRCWWAVRQTKRLSVSSSWPASRLPLAVAQSACHNIYASVLCASTSLLISSSFLHYNDFTEHCCFVSHTKVMLFLSPVVSHLSLSKLSSIFYILQFSLSLPFVFPCSLISVSLRWHVADAVLLTSHHALRRNTLSHDLRWI